MRQLYLALFAGSFVLVLALLQLVLLRVLNTVWWRRRWIKRLSLGLVLAALLGGLLWLGAVYLRFTSLIYIFATTISLIAVICLALIGALPLSGVINTIQHWWVKRREKRGLEENLSPQSLDRRLAMQKIAAVFPVSAVALGSGGLTKSFVGADIPEKTFYYENLPADLEGLRIFHVSDTHLGPYIQLDDVEDLMLRAEALKPDIMLISGDIADDLSMLPDAIKLFEQLKPRYGVFASMGNHDYYRGAPQVIDNFSRSSTPMLIDRGVTIRVKNADVFVGGADDPRAMGVPISDFLVRSVDQTLRDAPNRSFKIIMSHRPTGFDAAAARGVDLTLAGHTHGTQIGLLGKPLFNRWGGENYVWGHFTQGNSQCYTSSGVGHWFPFRLGCPTEAPIIILKRGTNPTTA